MLYLLLYFFKLFNLDRLFGVIIKMFGILKNGIVDLFIFLERFLYLEMFILLFKLILIKICFILLNWFVYLINKLYFILFILIFW